jgi:alpha-N-acetylglucosaminidase
MMTGFYRKRWELYFDSLRNDLQGKPAAPINFFWWERNWVKQHEQVAAVQTYPTLETMVKRIYGQ